jgi:hypothetical protein
MWFVVVVAVALMSGIASIFREWLALYFPQSVAASGAFQASVTTCFALSGFIVLFRMHRQISELQEARQKPDIKAWFNHVDCDLEQNGPTPYRFRLFLCNHNQRVTTLREVIVTAYGHKFEGVDQERDTDKAYFQRPVAFTTSSEQLYGATQDVGPIKLEDGIEVQCLCQVMLKVSAIVFDHIVVKVIDSFDNEYTAADRTKKEGS